MLVEDIKTQSPELRDKILRIESYYNLIRRTKVEDLKEYYKKLLKKHISLLKEDGFEIDLDNMSNLVDGIS